MNPESISKQPEYMVRMPDKLRIQQRLGQVAMASNTRTALTDIMSRRAGDLFDPENFVGVVVDSVGEYTQTGVMSEFPDAPSDYSNQLASQRKDLFLDAKMPKLVNSLLNNRSDKRRVLSYWFMIQYKKQYLDNQNGQPLDVEDEARMINFIKDNLSEVLKDDPPRKAKKAINRLRPEIRTHTSARHNGHRL